METKSKIINNIKMVDSFRTLLVANYSLPPAAATLFWLSSSILKYFKITSPILQSIPFIIISPPVLFTPYFVYVLFSEKRYGWLVTYILLVVLPAIFLIISIWNDFNQIGLILLLMLPFYIFCFFIKFSVEEWIREYNWEQQLIQQRQEEEERKRIEGML
jgi:hypothetical protein